MVTLNRMPAAKSVYIAPNWRPRALQSWVCAKSHYWRQAVYRPCRDYPECLIELSMRPLETSTTVKAECLQVVQVMESTAHSAAGPRNAQVGTDAAKAAATQLEHEGCWIKNSDISDGAMY